MNLATLISATACGSRPVILLESTRRLPDSAHAELAGLAGWLCRTFPTAIFRSGNAEGSDEVFADAVAGIDASRLELIIPNDGMGRKRRPKGCRCVSLDELPNVELERAAEVTRRASPASGRLSDYYLRNRGGSSSPASSKGSYLLRDTLKVTGLDFAGLAPAAFGVFFVNAENPDGGGTGHTVRVCGLLGVGVATQADWQAWARI